jgi:cyclohexanone monooxygenase
MHGFPNAFAVQMNQAANMVSNIPHNIVDHAATIARVVAYAERHGYAEVEPTQEAVSQWVSLIMTTEPSVITSTDCTPGFWNNEGQGWNEAFRRAQGHPGGAGGFFTHIDAWRRSGRYAGLMFNR